MHKKSTQTSTVDARFVTASEPQTESMKPCESTLAIIRQFARAYHFERALSPRHAAMFLN
jgi:hypothetical protein